MACAVPAFVTGPMAFMLTQSVFERIWFPALLKKLAGHRNADLRADIMIGLGSFILSNILASLVAIGLIAWLFASRH